VTATKQANHLNPLDDHRPNREDQIDLAKLWAAQSQRNCHQHPAIASPRRVPQDGGSLSGNRDDSRYAEA
jgi:hypothetical protein